MNRAPTTALAPLLQQFFIERLQKQRQASACTISTYRDAFRLFLTFAEAKLKKQPTDLAIEDLSAQLVLDFLDHLERHRKNSARSRNARFAALRAFFQLCCPEGASRAGGDTKDPSHSHEAFRATTGRLFKP